MGTLQSSRAITLFLGGDLMTGRGIDQVLPYPNDPRLYEPSVRDAVKYVELAEEFNGPISRPVSFSYIWGEALSELARVAPDVRVVNLETSVTKSDDYWRGKTINYRMHPDNIPCISAAKIDCCVLANNHVLDWGYSGLSETLTSLTQAGLRTVGAGRTIEEAETPGILDVPEKGRVIVFGFGATSSGIPRQWAATVRQAGVNLLADLSASTIRRIEKRVKGVKELGDIVVASIHWGGNWGYGVPAEQREFAHRLIARAGIDIVHGHSSHHPKGIEIYQGKLILYGCGDLLNDYEGIRGYENYRGDLSLMYFVTMDPDTGKLIGLQMTPTQIRRFKLRRASPEDMDWLLGTLNRAGNELGTRVELMEDGLLMLRSGAST